MASWLKSVFVHACNDDEISSNPAMLKFVLLHWFSVAAAFENVRKSWKPCSFVLIEIDLAFQLITKLPCWTL